MQLVKLMMLTALYLLGKPHYLIIILSICFYSVKDAEVGQEDHLDDGLGLNDAVIQVVRDVRQDSAQDSLQQRRIRLVRSVLMLFHLCSCSALPTSPSRAVPPSSPKPGPSNSRPGTRHDVDLLRSCLPPSTAASLRIRSPAPATSSPPASSSARPKRTVRRRVEYTEQDLTEDELSDDDSNYEPEANLDESSGECSEGSDEHSSDKVEVTFPVETILEKGKKQADRWSNPAVTDDEEDDTEVNRKFRRTVRADLRAEMLKKSKVEKSAWTNPNLWVPDPRDNDLLAEYVVKPVCFKSAKWRKFGRRAQEWIKDMVHRGELPTGKTKKAWADFAATAKLYLNGLKVLLGLFQSEMQKTMPEKLIDGRFHLWQLFDFKSKNEVECPDGIQHLLEQIPSPNLKKFAFGGFMELLNSLQDFLSTPEGKARFQQRTEKEETLSTIDMNILAKKQRWMEHNNLSCIRTNLKNGKYYHQFQGEVLADAAEKAKFMEQFEGTVTPKADTAIPAYLNHSTTRDLYKELVDLSSNKVVVTKKDMTRLGMGLLKRLHLKNGHRVQVWGLFTMKMWWQALRDGPARYPYLSADLSLGSPLDLQNPAVEQQLHRIEGVNVYVTKNPHRADPLDRTDPMVEQGMSSTQEQLDQWELVQGIACNIEKQKTCLNYPCWLWFSQPDVVYLRCYEEIRYQFMLANVMDPMDPDLPVFINMKGSGLIYPHGPTLNFTDFCLITGCSRVTSHVARKMFSQYITMQRSRVLHEAKEYTLCHSTEVDKLAYQNNLR